MGNVTAWAIQLQGLDRRGAPDRLSRADVDLVVIDRVNTVRGSEGFPLRAVVKQVHASRGKTRARKLCIAYVNVGQAEEYRTYWGPDWRAPTAERPGSPAFVIALDPEGWAGNYPVAYWDPAWRAILEGLVDGAIDDGFDGAMFDWVLGHADPDVAAAAREAGVDPAVEMAALIRDLAEYARARRPGFLVFPLNAAALLETHPDLVPVLSGVVQESVVFAGAASSTWDDPANADEPIPASGDWSTESHVRRLSALRAKGLTILTVDYATTAENREAAEALARRHGFVPFLSRTPLSRVPEEYLIAR
ncbi:MAG: endo alpha-1,4 polygalactosaminidase [Planctomycetota bacterium]